MTSFRDEWQPVKKGTDLPVCPVCDGDHRCAVSRDGAVAMCYRVEQASFKSSTGSAGTAYFHRLRERDPDEQRERIAKPKPSPEQQRREYEAMARAQLAVWSECFDATTDDQLAELSADLGLSVPTLERLRVAWFPGRHGAVALTNKLTPEQRRGWLFPMTDPAAPGKPPCPVSAVRHRLVDPAAVAFYDANKVSLPNSANGASLFIPDGVAGGDSPLFVIEGPTDCGAILDLGEACIGRPNNTAGNDLIRQWIGLKRSRTGEVVVFIDRDNAGSDLAWKVLVRVVEQRLGPEAAGDLMDDAGLSQAEKGTARAAVELAHHVARSGRTATIAAPPLGVKDARAWLNTGEVGNDDLWGVVDQGVSIKGQKFGWMGRFAS